MKVDLIDHMGSDLTVVNAARVSFNKTSSSLTEKDIKLINYLAKHKHWSPFSHCFVQFRIKAPIFVARQLGKHQVGLAWNEVSRRYVDSEPEFYKPVMWRGRAENAKQGSDGTSEDYTRRCSVCL
jgi:thymidylate synthase (FAD)